MGTILSGKRDGFGLFKCSDGQIYEGEWRGGFRHGQGTMSYYEQVSTTVYTGSWIHGLRDGYGKMTYASGNTYQGEWRGDKKHGQGSMVWGKGANVYNGEWNYDQPHGVGEFIWGEAIGSKAMLDATSTISNKQINNIYRGNWRNGQRAGAGTFFYADGSQYMGSFENNFKHGLGVMVYADGRIVAGQFSNDRIGVFSSHTAFDDKPAPRATEDVNMQFRLLIDDLFMKLSANGDEKNGPSGAQGKQTREIERIVLRFTSYLKTIFKKLSDEANHRRQAMKINDVEMSDPYISSWPTTFRTQVEARVLHRRFNCMTLVDMLRFLRDIGIMGASFTSSDLLFCLRQMKDQHRHVAKTTIANFLSRTTSLSGAAFPDVWGELLDGFLGPKDAQPNHDADTRQPLREREFVELLIRCIATADVKKRSFNSALSLEVKSSAALSHAVLDVLTRKIYPYSSAAGEAFSANEFVRAFYGELVQTTLSSPEVSEKLHGLWKTAAAALTTEQPVDVLQLRHIVRVFMTLKRPGNGLHEEVSIPQLAVIIGRARECESVAAVASESESVAAELQSTEPSIEEQQAVSQTQVLFDFSCLTSAVNFDDMVEMLCQVMASDAWSVVNIAPVAQDMGELPPSEEGAVEQQNPESLLLPSEENKSPEDQPPISPQTLEEKINERLLRL